MLYQAVCGLAVPILQCFLMRNDALQHGSITTVHLISSSKLHCLTKGLQGTLSRLLIYTEDRKCFIAGPKESYLPDRKTPTDLSSEDQEISKELYAGTQKKFTVVWQENKIKSTEAHLKNIDMITEHRRDQKTATKLSSRENHKSSELHREYNGNSKNIYLKRNRISKVLNFKDKNSSTDYHEDGNNTSTELHPRHRMHRNHKNRKKITKHHPRDKKVTPVLSPEDKEKSRELSPGYDNISSEYPPKDMKFSDHNQQDGKTPSKLSLKEKTFIGDKKTAKEPIQGRKKQASKLYPKHQTTFTKRLSDYMKFPHEDNTISKQLPPEDDSLTSEFHPGDRTLFPEIYPGDNKISAKFHPKDNKISEKFNPKENKISTRLYREDKKLLTEFHPEDNEISKELILEDKKKTPRFTLKNKKTLANLRPMKKGRRRKAFTEVEKTKQKPQRASTKSNGHNSSGIATKLNFLFGLFSMF